MARKRMIDPNIWESEDFSSLSMLGKILFIGLFSLADDEGRGNANPVYIRSKIFPHTAEKVRMTDVETALSEIAQSMSITFYVVNGRQYYALTHWNDWQKIDRPAPSKCPPPEDSEPFDESSTNVRRIFDESSTNDRRAFDESSTSVRENCDANKNKNMNMNINMKENTQKKGGVGGGRFSDFWSVYPKKFAKAEAEKAWNKLNPTDELVEKIIADVKRRTSSQEWTKENGQFIPYPATYLNKRRFDDEVYVPEKKADKQYELMMQMVNAGKKRNQQYEQHQQTDEELNRLLVNLD